MDEAVGCVGALAVARAFAFDPADFTVWRRPRRVDGLHDVRPDPLCILERLGEDADLNARAPRTLVALQMLRSRVADYVQPDVGQGSALRNDAPIDARRDDGVDRTVRDQPVTERGRSEEHSSELKSLMRISYDGSSW